MVELTLPGGLPVVGTAGRRVAWPEDTALVAIIRDGRPIAPSPDDTLEAGDELLFVATADRSRSSRAARPARPLAALCRVSDVEAALGKVRRGGAGPGSGRAPATRPSRPARPPAAASPARSWRRPASRPRRRGRAGTAPRPDEARHDQHQVSRLQSLTTAGSLRQR